VRQPVYVGRIHTIRPHPDADRVELIDITSVLAPGHALTLVTGKHYREGDLGIWLPPGTIIPGWLSYQLWMHGKTRIPQDFEVRDIPIRGVASPGLWVGQWYRNDSSVESVLNADDRERGGGRLVDGWIEWQHWQAEWQPGDVLDLVTLTSLRSSPEELLTRGQQEVDGEGRATDSVRGSIPAAGSISLTGGASA
jgi:hypothetical protein